MVGARRVVHDPPAQDREPAIVAGNRRGFGHGTADQIFHRLLHRRNPCRAWRFACAPLLHIEVVLGGRCACAADLSAQSHLACPPRFHLVQISPAHSCARRGRGPRRRISALPVSGVRQSLRRAGMAHRTLLIPARPPLSHDGVDVFGSAGWFSGSTRGASTTLPKPTQCCSRWAPSPANAG